MNHEEKERNHADKGRRGEEGLSISVAAFNPIEKPHYTFAIHISHWFS